MHAYFAHRELEIPPSKRSRESYKNLQDAANIQWHRYIKRSNNICYSTKPKTEKYKKRDQLRSRFYLYRFDLCPFSADFVVCVDIWSRNLWWTPLSDEFSSLLENKLNKGFHTKRQDKQRTHSPRLRSESGREQFRFSDADENEHSSACR